MFNNSLIQSSLTEEEIEYLKANAKKYDRFRLILIKLLNARSKIPKTKESDFDVANWSELRAFRDGKDVEIGWWLNILSKDTKE